MNYVKYNRSFIMLEEQNNKFASKASTPIKGYLKVETGNNKGAMRCAVQNLYYYPKKDYVYKLILFGKKGEKTIHTIIGNLLINRQGNGETYFRFHPLDIDGKGNPYHYYSTAIIAAASTINADEPLHPVLKGITFEENSSFQSQLFEINSEEETEDKATGREDAKDVVAAGEAGGESKAEDIEQPAAVENIKTEDAEGSADVEEVEDIKVDADSLADVGEDGESPAEESPQEEGLQIDDKGLEEPDESIEGPRVYNNFYNQYILNACAHTCRVAEFHEDVVPFSKDRTGAQWKKIINVANLPLVSPGAHYFATQYHHYIFGAKADEKGIAVRYYIGIPGRFLSEEQPDGGYSGFTFWQPIRGAESLLQGLADDIKKRKSAYGYWIVAIDAKTGNIEEV